MARKSVTTQRRREIIVAFMRCINRYGLRGTMLEHVARESCIKRPALRHFIGNREKIILAIVQHLIDESRLGREKVDQLLNGFNGTERDAVQLILSQYMIIKSDKIITIVSLIDYAQDNEDVRALLNTWYIEHYEWVIGVLKRFYKHSKSLNYIAENIINTVLCHSVFSRVIDSSHTWQIGQSINALVSTLTRK